MGRYAHRHDLVYAGLCSGNINMLNYLSSSRPQDPDRKMFGLEYVEVEPGTGGAGYPHGPWELTAEGGKAVLRDCVYMRGALFKNAGDALDVALDASGEAYIGYELNLESGEATVKLSSTIAGVVTTSPDAGASTVKVLLYKVQISESDGVKSCVVLTDYRHMPTMVLYI